MVYSTPTRSDGKKLSWPCPVDGHDVVMDLPHKPDRPRAIRVCRECWLARNRAAAVDRHLRRRNQALDAYGWFCACCGESESMFLAIDHVEGGGNRQRRENGWGGNAAFYRWLEKQGYPPGFRTLCHNCNYAESRGGCPHRTGSLS